VILVSQEGRGKGTVGDGPNPAGTQTSEPPSRDRRADERGIKSAAVPLAYFFTLASREVIP